MKPCAHALVAPPRDLEEPLNARQIVMLALGLLVLAGCGSTPEPKPVEAVKLGPAVVAASSNSYGGHTALKCGKDYTQIDVALGAHTEPNASYTLTETRGKESPYDNVQKFAKLHAQPPTGTVVKSAIVHTSNADDKEYVVNIGNNGVVEADLMTNNYVFLPGVYNSGIGSVSLCTTAASPTGVK
jgi:hypothetical protein